ncbi:MAG: AAA family ATPase [Gammaproteobacteria bacterium]|nr:AAA family ATPase [Gammaproteobacteria bacterium]
MQHRNLPIGIQSFRTLREDGCYYVDKTPLVEQLVRQGRHYFLSRPRRFGKSLLIDTLREFFSCSEDLFEGLRIHPDWDWHTPHPVVRLSFDGKYNEPGDLAEDILGQLEILEENAKLDPGAHQPSGPVRLRRLLTHLHRNSGRQVVVLVDEYDKPILDVLSDAPLARANRDYLRGFYGMLKGCADQVRFVFVTGVSMFSKVSLFSGLNNLQDISIDPQFASICGYTDHELDTVFRAELPGLDREEIRDWYNGYNWLGGEPVYNPYDLLLLFRRRKFEAHWFDTGSPRFLFEVMMEKGVGPLDVEGLIADGQLVSTFDVGEVSVDALMFQTGYLTITGEERRDDGFLYRLDYPNKEVRVSVNSGLLQFVTGRGLETREKGRNLCRLLADNDFEGFADRLRALFAGIPYQWQAGTGLARYEAWYAGILYVCLRTIGVDLRVEESTAHGRTDMALAHGGQAFVLEFKMADEGEDPEAATARAIGQARARGYADTYRDAHIHLVGVVFSRETRNVLSVRAESA